MPPHCDALDGPVVTAARAALAAKDVDLVLPMVHAAGEAEIREAFDAAVAVTALGGEASDLAQRWFFETVVRVHRAGEGAPFTGLKPAGLDVGPVIPAAVRALDTGSADELVAVMCGELREQVERRLARAIALRAGMGATVPEARAYVEAMLGLQVWANAVHRQVIGEPHGRPDGHAHG